MRADAMLPLTRRSVLQAISLAFACSSRPGAACLTSITDALARLFRFCCFGNAGPRLAGAG